MPPRGYEKYEDKIKGNETNEESKINLKSDITLYNEKTPTKSAYSSIPPSANSISNIDKNIIESSSNNKQSSRLVKEKVAHKNILVHAHKTKSNDSSISSVIKQETKFHANILQFEQVSDLCKLLFHFSYPNKNNKT